MTTNDYKEFFDLMWQDFEPSFAIIDNKEVRILEGSQRAEYIAENGTTTTKAIKEITFLAAELPQSWRAKPGDTLTIRGKTYEVRQETPMQPVAPDGSLLNLPVYPL